MHASGCAAFDYDFRRLVSLVEREPRTPDELLRLLDSIYAQVFAFDFARYDLVRLQEAAPALLDDFYDLRLALRGRIAGWQAQGLLQAGAEAKLRDCFRALRYATDLIGELRNGFRTRRLGRSKRVAFAEDTLFHPELRDATRHTFQSGDILLVRGTIHNSAAIARIGDVDSQFSHAALIYIDKRGCQYVVEALIADGATYGSLHYALAHNLGRAVIFRHPDADLAHRAAETIFRKVRRSRWFFRRHIPYDFSMELDETGRMFCSKLIRVAFAEASNGEFVMPAFPTRFEQASWDFLDRIGVTAVRTFAPGDMELEPGLEAIAEWRDFDRTSNLRLQDFVMAKLFEWMEREGYTFEETAWIRVVSAMGRATAYLPGPVKSLIASFAPKVPLSMKRETIAALTMLHYTAEPLFRRLRKLEQEAIRERGYPLHPREILKHLEDMRRDAPARIGYLHGPSETVLPASRPQTA
jgi:hypothetical protein